MYYSFLSLTMISFDFDDFFQASQPSTVKARLTATFFGRLAKTPQIFFKKTLVNTATPLKRKNFLGPIGDPINGVPLYEF